MVKVTSVAQAMELPEIESAIWDIKRAVLTSPEEAIAFRQRTAVKCGLGDTVIERKLRPFCPHPTGGDQILLFVDADGRRMQIVYTPEGPAKTEVIW